MSELRFFVPGIPAPGGSKNAFALKKGGVYTGRVAVVDAGGQKTKDWRSAVKEFAINAVKQHSHEAFMPFAGQIEVELTFRMPRPKSHFRSNGLELKPGSPRAHVFKPDVLKLARSTEDAMTGICYVDDAQIVKEIIEKVYSDQPGAWIVIREISQ